ncbi:MAG: hypothetical protein ABIK09_14115 [Pseudomonadota bacterium]
MSNEMDRPARITVTKNAQAELGKLMLDAEGRKPRIYTAGFG